MPKKSISSLELAALVNELNFLEKGKVSQIYHLERELLMQLHAPGHGKQLLKIVAGKFICLTKNKETPLKPSSFCMQLRKYLSNAFIKSIEQKDSERIIIFEFDKKESYFLIIELFSKGNIVLTDSKYNIIGVLERQEWKDRSVKVKEKYIFPKSDVNWKKLTQKDLSSILAKSDKKNVAVTLATEIGLGGLYAEEICAINNIDKNKLPKEIDEKEVKLIVNELNNFIEKIKNPKGFIYDDQITPFELLEKVKEKTKTYSEAIDMINPFIIISPYEKKIIMLKKQIGQQQDAILSLQNKIKLNTKKGERIYEKYSPINKLLQIVKDMKKEKDWVDISKELKKEKKIKGVDLKKKKIVIEL